MKKKSSGLKPPRNIDRYLAAKELKTALCHLVDVLGAGRSDSIKMRANINVYLWDPIWEKQESLSFPVLTSQSFIVEKRG